MIVSSAYPFERIADAMTKLETVVPRKKSSSQCSTR